MKFSITNTNTSTTASTPFSLTLILLALAAVINTRVYAEQALQNAAQGQNGYGGGNGGSSSLSSIPATMTLSGENLGGYYSDMMGAATSTYEEGTETVVSSDSSGVGVGSTSGCDSTTGGYGGGEFLFFLSFSFLLHFFGIWIYFL